MGIDVRVRHRCHRHARSCPALTTVHDLHHASGCASRRQLRRPTSSSLHCAADVQQLLPEIALVPRWPVARFPPLLRLRANCARPSPHPSTAPTPATPPPPAACTVQRTLSRSFQRSHWCRAGQSRASLRALVANACELRAASHPPPPEAPPPRPRRPTSNSLHCAARAQHFLAEITFGAALWPAARVPAAPCAPTGAPSTPSPATTSVPNLRLCLLR